MTSVLEAQRRALERHRADLDGALVYVDAGAAEAVAAGLGLAALQGLGAAAVCDLAAASPCDLATAALLSGRAEPVRRVALLVTGLLRDAAPAVLAACRLCPGASQFTVLCAVSEAAHHDEAPALYPSTAYAAYAAAWQQQLNEARLAAGVGPCSLAPAHCPLLLCPLNGAAFVLAARSAAASLPRVGQLAAGYSTTAGSAAAGDSDEEEPARPPSAGAAPGAAPASGLSLLSHALVDVCAVLGYRPEAFALGPCSRSVCQAMAFVPAAPGDLPPAALVLMDRWLDPVAPALHADLLAQRLYDLLQPGPAGEAGGSSGSSGGSGSGGGSDGSSIAFTPVSLELPMPSLDAAGDAAAAAEGSGGGGGGADAGREGSLLPGSLRHPDDAQAERWLEFLLTRRGRDALLFVRKWLREAVRKEGISPQQLPRFKPGTITAAELHSLADALRRRSLAAAHRHASLLQLAEAAAAAAEGAHADRWEALAREERQLLFACAESSQAAASHLADLARLAASPDSPLTLTDLVLLLTQAWALLPSLLPWFASADGGAQPFQPQQEQQLANALVEATLAHASSGSTQGACDAGGAWQLERLAARAALVGSKRGGGGGGEGAEESEAELQGLRLEARDAAQALLSRLQQLAASRGAHLKQLRQLAAVGEDGAPRCTPLLRQIAEHILRDQPLPDLHAGATSLSGLVRAGLGRFGLKGAGPKPSDCSTVVLFVLGAVSVAELHEVQQACDERAAQHSAAQAGGGEGGAGRPPPRVIVGGTALLRQADLARHLFADLHA